MQTKDAKAAFTCMDSCKAVELKNKTTTTKWVTTSPLSTGILPASLSQPNQIPPRG